MVAAAKETIQALTRIRREAAVAPRTWRCPACRDSRWIKSYTPWGCPTSVPCLRCAAATRPR